MRLLLLLTLTFGLVAQPTQSVSPAPAPASQLIRDQLQGFLDGIGATSITDNGNEGSFYAEALFQMNMELFGKQDGKVKLSCKVKEHPFTLYLYRFIDAASAENCAAFAAGSLWEAGKPSRAHKDELMTKDNLVLVISGTKPSVAANELGKLGFSVFRYKP